MIRIRVDDFPATKDFASHGWEEFARFNQVMLDTIGTRRYLLGVIPAHASVNMLLNLRSGFDNVELAMHGITHDESRQNEFHPNLDVSEIITMLDVSRKRLESLTRKKVDVYMPPHNAVDAKTLEALECLRFKAVTGGPGTDTGLIHSDIYNKLDVLYSNPPLEYGRCDELLSRGAVQHLLRFNDEVPVYLTLHLPWETNIGLGHLRNLMTLIADQVEDFSCR